MTTNLANKLLAQKATIKNNVNINTDKVKLTAKDDKTMEKPNTILKKTSSINVIFDNPSVIELTGYFINIIKPVLLEDAVKSIRHKLGEYWFDKIYQGKHLDYLANQFDEIAVKAIAMAKGQKEIDLTGYEYVWSQEQIEEYKKTLINQTYSFEEVKEYIVYSFDDITQKVISTLIMFKC